MKPLAFCKNHGVPRFPTPKDPFADWLPIEERNKINANKIVCKNYEAGVNLSYTNTTFYNYSEDGLTVFSHNGNNKPIMTYTFYPNGKLKNYIVPSSNTNDTYTYTDDGKLLSMESSFHKIQCYYTNTGVDSLASWFYSDRYEKFIKNEKYIISYNSKGYKKEIFRYNIEKGSYIKDLEDLYEFDKNDRLTRIYRKQENKKEKLIEEYFYSKNQFERYSYNYWDNTRRKVKYVYDENNDLIEETHYNGDERDNWYTYFVDIYSYTYNGSTSTENITPTNTCHIYTSADKIIVANTMHRERINVYDISGRLRYTTISKSDKEEINLPTNQIYIVQVGNKRNKLKL
ncbi:hypothetical protein [uncultured Parabacteroides sp.]|uniref:hypothetical protein n=1 Tax=uncultured Parabacteroides sp. TaxID=512312 RepID=UPI00259B5DF3|nr:hypothetical protein [uncultured Parabacteroides sp.]